MYAQHYKKNKEPILALNKSKNDLIQAIDIKKGVHKQYRTGYVWHGANQENIIIPSTKVNNGHGYKVVPPIIIKMKDWLAFFGL